jgi:hypothetical protein
MANFWPYFLANSSFDQLPKKNLRILAVDRNFLKAKNTIIRTFDQLPKNNLQILAVNRNFINVIFSYFKILINCKNPSVLC